MTTSFSSKLLVISLFDDKIRETVKTSDCLESYLVDTKVEKAILNYFKNLENSTIDQKIDYLHKLNSGTYKLSDSDLSEAENLYDLYNDYVSSDQKSTLHSIEKFIKSKRIKKVIGDNYEKYGSVATVDDEFQEKLAEAMDISLSPKKLTWNYGDSEDLSLFLSEDAQLEIIPSGYEMINESLSDGGYLKTNLVCFAAASGVGKSTAMLSEACHFIKNGYKVLYINLGDMSPRSVFFRLLSTLSGVNSKTLRTEGYLVELEKYKDIIKNNFRNIILEAGEAGLASLIAIIKKNVNEFNPDVIVLDYDQNVANLNGDSLYDFFGQMYIKLKGLAQSTNTLVMVASQIKIEAYKEELLNKECLADSSKKANNLDLLVTFGVNKEVKSIGKMNLAKVRDGSHAWAHVQYQNGIGQIPIITKDTYNDILLSEKDKATEVAKYFE